jgi:hypothetical protein
VVSYGIVHQKRIYFLDFPKKNSQMRVQNFGTEKKSLTTMIIVKNNDASGASQLWYRQYIKRGPSLFAVVLFG